MIEMSKQISISSFFSLFENVQMIPKTEKDAETHLNDSNDDRELHFDRIGECDLILRHLPNGIQSKWIRSAGKHLLIISIQRIIVRRWFQCHRFHFVQIFIAELHSPRRSEDVQRFGEDIVVNETRVDREETHEENDVSSTKEDRPDFLCSPFVFQRTFFQDHPKSEESDDQSVTRISEHHREQKRESDQHERHRIDLTIRGHTVRIDQILETLSEFVQLVMRGRLFSSDHSIQHRRNSSTTTGFLKVIDPRRREERRSD